DKQAQIVFPQLKKSMNLERPEVINLDTATTVERGLRNDPSDEAARVKEFFNKKRKEVIDQGGVTQTGAAAERPVRAAERMMQEGREAYGGDQGIDQARRAIQQSGQEEVGAAENLVRETQSRIDDTARNYDNILMEDEGLGSRLRES